MMMCSSRLELFFFLFHLNELSIEQLIESALWVCAWNCFVFISIQEFLCLVYICAYPKGKKSLLLSFFNSEPVIVFHFQDCLFIFLFFCYLSSIYVRFAKQKKKCKNRITWKKKICIRKKKMLILFTGQLYINLTTFAELWKSVQFWCPYFFFSF